MMRVGKLALPSFNANWTRIYSKNSRNTLWTFDLSLGRGVSPNFQPRRVSLRLRQGYSVFTVSSCYDKQGVWGTILTRILMGLVLSLYYNNEFYMNTCQVNSKFTIRDFRDPPKWPSPFNFYSLQSRDIKVALGVCFALKFVERRFTSFHIFNYLR